MEEGKAVVSGRFAQIDALRSCALGGILLVNIWYFADPYTLGGTISPQHATTADLWVRFTVAALFEAKFYLLFSFLFGYSFVLQERTAISAGQSPVGRTKRRLVGLLVLGLLHGVFLFYGDILLTYALMGLILLATRSMRTSSAVITGSALIGVIGSVILAVGLVIAATFGGPGITMRLDRPVEPLTQNPAEALAENASNFLETVAGVLLLQGPLSLAMFYLGLAAARAQFLERRLPLSLLTTTAAACLPLGLAAGVLQAYLTSYVDRDQFAVLAVGISTLTAPLLTAGYVSLLLLFFRTRPGARVCRFLAPAGRIALTNYLMQSVVMAVLFTGLGLRLADQLPAPAVAGVAVVLLAAQMVASKVLLDRARTGPAEWVLRRLTYGRQKQPARGSSAG